MLTITQFVGKRRRDSLAHEVHIKLAAARLQAPIRLLQVHHIFVTNCPRQQHHERERATERDRETETETERQKDRETETERQKDRETETERQRGLPQLHQLQKVKFPVFAFKLSHTRTCTLLRSRRSRE